MIAPFRTSARAGSPRWLTAAVAAAGLLGARVAAAAPLREEGYGLPRDASVDGHRIDWLIHVGIAMTSILFVIMVGWMLIAVFKHDEKHPARYDHGTSKSAKLGAVGLAGAVFFIVDGTFFVNSTMDLHNAFDNFEKAESDPNALRIEINAHQWAWEARYAGPDGKFGTKDDIVTLNDVRIPTGVPVIFQLGSTDVIHSFYLPNFRNKVDVVPGTINRMWIIAKDKGEFDIGCTQHCGTNHYKMRGVLTVYSPEDYAKWAAEASRIAVRGYNDEDKEAHWGWDWRKDL